MASACDKLTNADRRKMVSYIMEGQRRGIELGFIKCNDGKYAGECEGSECSLKFPEGICRGAKVKPDQIPWKFLFHTHPEREGVLSHYLSPNDLRSVRDLGGGKFVDLGILTRPRGDTFGCVGYFKNGKPKVRCVSARDIPSAADMNALLDKLQPDELWDRASDKEKAHMKTRAVARLNFESKSCVIS